MQKLIEFESGLKLVFVRNTAVRSVAAGVFVGAGVVRETPDIAGISHFIEHMVFKGTQTRSSFDIVNEIDSIGAQINAFTAKSYTCFHTVSVDTNARRCVEILSDLYFNPTFDGEELDKERKVVIEEINESDDTPDDLCIENLVTAFFSGHPLETPILGEKKTLAKMSSDTLREYRDRFYVPTNTVVCLAGNLTLEQAKDIVKTYFEDRIEDKTKRAFAPLAQAEPRSIFVKKKKKIEQAHFALAFPAFGYNHEKSIATQLMSLIFGMGMSSRLFQRIREKLGLCYTVVGYPSSYENNGNFIIYTSTNPKEVENAVRAIRDEVDLLVEKGVSEEELKKGKEQLKASLVLGQESTSAMMRSFGSHALMTGQLYDFDARIKAIDDTTVEDIAAVCSYIFDTEKMCASLVSPVTDIDVLKVYKSAK